MGKTKAFGHWVLAGRMTHYELNGVILCGCLDPAYGEVKPFVKSQGGSNLHAKYLLPLCMACVSVNQRRWEEGG